MYKILNKEKLNNAVEAMEIHAPFVAKRCQPGQFIILRVSKEGERVPLTIADYDREKESVTIIYQKVGLTTQRLGQMSPGDSLEDFAGPLGQPTKLVKKDRVLGVAGGVGAAPLYPQLKHLHALGTKVDLIIGGRSADLIILEEKYKPFCDHIYLATNDGSRGKKGFVTDVLKDLIEAGQVYDEVIAIGPVIMMKAVVGVTKPLGIQTNVSLNPIMVDGTGMCGGCRVKINDETKFACVDGPDFDGFAVDFDELMSRQKYYQAEEKHVCQIDRQLKERNHG